MNYCWVCERGEGGGKWVKGWGGGGDPLRMSLLKYHIYQNQEF